MKTHRLALERRGPRRLEVRGGTAKRDVTVSLDGAPISAFDASGLDLGATLRLPDGGALLLQRIPRRWWSLAFRDELRAERDGVPLPGSDCEPRTIRLRAARFLVLLGLAILLFGLVWLLFSTRATAVAALPLLEGLFLVVFGILAALGLRLPIVAGAGLLVVDTVVPPFLGAPLNPLGVVLRALFVVHLVRAWRRTR